MRTVKRVVNWLMTSLALSLVIGCHHGPAAMPAPALPYTTATDSLIDAGLREADLVILGTPDSMESEAVMAPSTQFGFQVAWWDARIAVDSVIKGKLSHAKRVDYGDLPMYMTPQLPFKLNKHQIVVQVSTQWQTAPIVVGQRAVYFLKKCYRCVTLPSRMQYNITASPWFAILALTPDQYGAVHGRYTQSR
jgi:hypothetical protein